MPFIAALGQVGAAKNQGDPRMTNDQVPRTHWSTWTLEIKVWKILAGLVILPILVLWFRVVHQNDEILALSHNEVVTDLAGLRTWEGSNLRGIEHKPVANSEVHVLLLEPDSTVNTGNVQNALTVEEPERL
jgi:hypothetical protein